MTADAAENLVQREGEIMTKDNAELRPAWHKGMYGCPQDMYAASDVLTRIAQLEDERDSALAFRLTEVWQIKADELERAARFAPPGQNTNWLLEDAAEYRRKAEA